MYYLLFFTSMITFLNTSSMEMSCIDRPKEQGNLLMKDQSSPFDILIQEDEYAFKKNIFEKLSRADRHSLEGTCKKYWNGSIFNGYGKMPENIKSKMHLCKKAILFSAVGKNNLQDVEWLIQNSDCLRLPLCFTHNYYHQRVYKINVADIVAYNKQRLFSSEEKKDKWIAATKQMKKLLTAHNYLKKKEYIAGDYKFFLQCCNGNINTSYRYHTPDDRIAALSIFIAMQSADVNTLYLLNSNSTCKAYIQKASDKLLYQFVFHHYYFDKKNLKKVKRVINTDVFDIEKRNYDCQFTWRWCLNDYVTNHTTGFLSSFIFQELIWDIDYIQEVQKILIKYKTKERENYSQNCLVQ